MTKDEIIDVIKQEQLHACGIFGKKRKIYPLIIDCCPKWVTMAHTAIYSRSNS